MGDVSSKLLRISGIQPEEGYKDMGNPGHESNTRSLRVRGVEGDAMNALPCGADRNLRKSVRKLRIRCARSGILITPLLKARNHARVSICSATACT